VRVRNDDQFQAPELADLQSVFEPQQTILWLWWVKLLKTW
jgi:hypothetical protein